MGRKKKSDGQKEQDKKGADRMKRFEENQTKKELPMPSKKVEDDDMEEVTIIFHEKNVRSNPDDDWHEEKCTYMRKKKRSKK